MSTIQNRTGMLTVLLTAFLMAPVSAQSSGQVHSFADFDCGTHRVALDTGLWMEGVRSGQLVPNTPPDVPGRNFAAGAPGIVAPSDLFAYEDTDSVLLTNFSFDDLNELMVDAANALLVAHGDNFDFIGFWLNFDADHIIGAAFYKLVENDVLGIGDVGTIVGEPPIFNLRPDLGLAGNNIEGIIMMWNVNTSWWATGTGSDADFTRLALAQEYEHRFAMFLPPLLDGRVLQGDDNICGRTLHWGWQVDGQGSGMEIAEWTGTSPATPDSTFVSFNTDIPGSVFSYTDLYLMGYQSAGAMDAGNSELRFMDGSDCSSDYFGTPSTFTSFDIVASAGPRIPNAADEDKDYRSGWIMLHLPGAPPTAADRQRAADILNQHTTDWNASTLGLGTMDNTLPPPALTDLGNALAGTHGLPALIGNSSLTAGSSVTLRLEGALENANAVLVLGLSAINAPFKGGVMVPSVTPALFVDMSTDGDGLAELMGVWPGGIPSGFETYFQCWIPDPAGPAGLAASNALKGMTP